MEISEETYCSLSLSAEGGEPLLKRFERGNGGGLSRKSSPVNACAPGKAPAILADESSARGNCLFTAKSPARRAGVTRGVKRAGKGRKVR